MLVNEIKEVKLIFSVIKKKLILIVLCKYLSNKLMMDKYLFVFI